MKLSKKYAERNELYGRYIFYRLQKVHTFEEYLKIRNKLIKEFVVNRNIDSIKNMI